MRIAVSKRHLAEIRAILKWLVPDADYLAFGSRIGASYHRYSDLDIAVKAAGELPLLQLSALEEAFAESDLPFRVDVVDLHRASHEFQHIVEARHVKI